MNAIESLVNSPWITFFIAPIVTTIIGSLVFMYITTSGKNNIFNEMRKLVTSPKQQRKNFAKSNNRLMRYDYRSNEIPYVDRETQLHQINNFLKSNGKFIWWSASGESGAGKSRFFFEHTQRLKGWRCYYLTQETIEKIGINFQKAVSVSYKKSFIIIDGIHSNNKFAYQLINFLCDQRPQKIIGRIRLLIIERDFINLNDKATYKKLWGGIFDLESVREKYFNDSSIDMNETTINERKKIIYSLFALHQIDPDQSIINKLLHIGNISQLILYFDMITNVPIKQQLLKRDVVDYFVEREKRHVYAVHQKLGLGSLLGSQIMTIANILGEINFDENIDYIKDIKSQVINELSHDYNRFLTYCESLSYGVLKNNHMPKIVKIRLDSLSEWWAITEIDEMIKLESNEALENTPFFKLFSSCYLKGRERLQELIMHVLNDYQEESTSLITKILNPDFAISLKNQRVIPDFSNYFDFFKTIFRHTPVNSLRNEQIHQLFLELIGYVYDSTMIAIYAELCYDILCRTQTNNILGVSPNPEGSEFELVFNRIKYLYKEYIDCDYAIKIYMKSLSQIIQRNNIYNLHNNIKEVQLLVEVDSIPSTKWIIDYTKLIVMYLHILDNSERMRYLDYIYKWFLYYKSTEHAATLYALYCEGVAIITSANWKHKVSIDNYIESYKNNIPVVQDYLKYLLDTKQANAHLIELVEQNIEDKKKELKEILKKKPSNDLERIRYLNQTRELIKIVATDISSFESFDAYHAYYRTMLNYAVLEGLTDSVEEKIRIIPPKYKESRKLEEDEIARKIMTIDCFFQNKNKYYIERIAFYFKKLHINGIDNVRFIDEYDKFMGRELPGFFKSIAGYTEDLFSLPLSFFSSQIMKLQMRGFLLIAFYLLEFNDSTDKLFESLNYAQVERFRVLRNLIDNKVFSIARQIKEYFKDSYLENRFDKEYRYLYLNLYYILSRAVAVSLTELPLIQELVSGNQLMFARILCNIVTLTPGNEAALEMLRNRAEFGQRFRQFGVVNEFEYLYHLALENISENSKKHRKKILRSVPSYANLLSLVYDIEFPNFGLAQQL